MRTNRVEGVCPKCGATLTVELDAKLRVIHKTLLEVKAPTQAVGHDESWVSWADYVHGVKAPSEKEEDTSL